MNLRVFLPAVFSAALLAQTTTTPNPSRFSDLQAYLGLTSDQVTQLQQLRRSPSADVQNLLQQIRTKQQSLKEALNTTGANPATVGQLVLDIQALRQQISQARQSVNQQALNVLNADQKAKLKNLSDAAALAPSIREAVVLGLIAPPAGAGMGPGARFRGMAGRGMGRMQGMRPGMQGMRRRMPANPPQNN